MRGRPAPTAKELQQLCKHNGLRTEGTREQLIDLLMEWKAEAARVKVVKQKVLVLGSDDDDNAYYESGSGSEEADQRSHRPGTRGKGQQRGKGQ